ncbi:MAG TPA: OmpH family outer membrane protein [Prolixibacteraceae bacterium]|nr:OmpH family outer membrane protein [Prolixibacteraceae bacterium]
MKNTSLVLIVVLFIAVAGLYILHFSGNKLNGSGVDSANDGSVSSGLKIAYLKIDSLVVNYDFAQEMQDGFTKQQEAFTKEYTDKRSRFESQATAFQEKVQRGGFLTQERAMQERDRLMGEEQLITKLDQELSSKLAQIQADNNKQLLDSVMNYLKIYNKELNYNYIFNSAEVLLGDETHNITKEILVGLNTRYSKAKLK